MKQSLALCGVGVGAAALVSAAVYKLATVLKSPAQARELSEEEQRLLLLQQRKPPALWNTVLFFPDIPPDAPTHVYNTPSPNTRQFLSYFENAKSSLQICILLCSFPQLEDIIVNKKRDGLFIQVIVDYDVAHDRDRHFLAQRCRTHNIQLRMKNTGHLMHNKFAIIDGEAVLTGSLNWTIAAFNGNSENVVITTHEGTVKQYTDEFNKLWKNSERNATIRDDN